MPGLEWLSPDHIISSAGGSALWITLAIIFAECGLLLGFFLPGDTLLFSVGLFIANDVIDHSVWFAATVLAIGAILGNVVGYEIGRRAGPAILSSERQRLLKREHVERTEAFFERYGTPAIILARFVPIVRTVITVVAGVARMNRRRYLVLSTIGGIIWVFGVTLLGYFLGRVPFVKHHVQPHLDLIILGVVVLSVIPVVLHFLMDRRRSQRDKGHEAGDHAASEESRDVVRTEGANPPSA